MTVIAYLEQIMTITIQLGWYLIPLIITLLLLIIGVVTDNKSGVLDGALYAVGGMFLILMSWLIYFMACFFHLI